MRTDIRIDTICLRSHIDYKEQERRYVEVLLDHLHMALALSDEETRPVIVSMIQKAESIHKHCVTMSEKLDEICYGFEEVSRYISDILLDYIAINKTGQQLE